MDTKNAQVVEVLGRNRLTMELLRDGLEVAVPVRDRGIDLIVYMDLANEVKHFTAHPIQLKAASRRCFRLEKKYEKIRNLILAFVWNLEDPENAETYALTYCEAFAVARKMKYTVTNSWRNKGVYNVTMKSPRQGRKLLQLLAPYKMTKSSWREALVCSQGR